MGEEEVQGRAVRSTRDVGRGWECGALSRLSNTEPCMRLVEWIWQRGRVSGDLKLSSRPPWLESHCMIFILHYKFQEDRIVELFILHFQYLE